ncbi:MAG: preprotein translocase subunit SecG [Bacteroidetes bacterium GWF2_41_31]|nr:MAG: preprotein translocase subunit SecG [Bacteroidetes bacterium GWF2_41_31]OFZ03557.1 MAG: preprotein translocase subunit SecG [Bacteroidetes bacterium RIFOXYB12_FULL_41_6]
MYIFVSILILVVSILLGLIVLVQNPKGGGLAANFASGGAQFMGARQTADFLEKASWGLAIALLFLSLTATMIIPRDFGVKNPNQSEIIDQVSGQKSTAPIDFQAPEKDTPKE